MVLAECLVRLGFSGLVIAHLNHGLRGAEADADEALVRRWAEKNGCACEVSRVDVAERATAGGCSIETAGRLVRREFFRQVAARRGLHHVVLAHHADDQVETMLMNLMRGAGTHGLAAMRPVSSWEGLEIVRPLLGIWRRDLEAWARAQRLEWREDASNRSLDHFRNRVRHGVLPALETAAGRDVREALRRAAVLAAEDDDELVAAARRHLTDLESPTAGTLNVAGLRSLSPSLARRVLRVWLRGRGVPDVGFAVVEQALAVARSAGRPASCNLAGGVRLRRRAGVLFLDAQ
jgi:tRNA(Ile)-lysidine synthase